MRKLTRKSDVQALDSAKSGGTTPRGPAPLQRLVGNQTMERVVQKGARSAGQPLETATRELVEPRFETDFSDVRVHADATAAESASAIAARAFTVDRDIVFGAGQYAPQTEAGRRLLLHELSHVAQQRAGVRLEDGISGRDDPGEPEADRMAADVSAGRSARPLFSGPRSAVQRQALDSPPTPELAQDPLPPAEELAARIANCIGIWETNRGKDVPAPKESRLDTVAGVHASMATIEQATMPYAVDALLKFKDLRAKATPPLTAGELADAKKRCVAVVTLLKSVDKASNKGTTADDFIKEQGAQIFATGLSEDDVRTMFNAVTLKTTVDKAHQAVIKEKGDAAQKKKLAAEMAAIPEKDRLGLGESSLKAYIKRGDIWGENRAGWQRKAVSAMAGNVGARIAQVAVSDSGTAFAIPNVKARVDKQMAKSPVPSLQEIVTAVAQQNNPKEKSYGNNVWKTYERLYLK